MSTTPHTVTDFIKTNNTSLGNGFSSGGLALNNHDLYYADDYGNIFKVDLRDTRLTPIKVTGGLYIPRELKIRGNYLYISESNQISRLNIRASLPTNAEQIISKSSSGLFFYGNKLIVSQINYRGMTQIGSVKEYDLTRPLETPKMIMADQDSFFYCMKVQGNRLHVVKSTYNIKNSKIVRHNLNSSSAITITDTSDSQYNASLVKGDNDTYYISRGNKIYTATETSDFRELLTIRNSELAQMVFSDGYLYVAIPNQNKIVRIDVSRRPARTLNFIDGLNAPRGLALKGDFLYFTEASGLIKRVDIGHRSARPILVANGLNNPNYLKFNGNYLYISEADKVSKINTAFSHVRRAESVITGLRDANGIGLQNNYLYVAVPEGSESRVLRYDIRRPSIRAEEIFTWINHPIDIVPEGKFLYMVESDGNKLIKATPLDLPNVSVYPSLATDVINVSGAPEGTSYQINRNLTNGEVTRGVLNSSGQIDIQSLSSGLYLFTIYGTYTDIFVKR